MQMGENLVLSEGIKLLRAPQSNEWLANLVLTMIKKEEEAVLSVVSGVYNGRLGVREVTKVGLTGDIYNS